MNYQKERAQRMQEALKSNENTSPAEVVKDVQHMGETLGGSEHHSIEMDETDNNRVNPTSAMGSC